MEGARFGWPFILFPIIIGLSLTRESGLEACWLCFQDSIKKRMSSFLPLYAFLIKQVQEKKIKKISEMNIDPSKDPGSSSPLPLIANGVHADKPQDYLSKDFPFPPGGIPSLRLPLVVVLYAILFLLLFWCQIEL